MKRVVASLLLCAFHLLPATRSAAQAASQTIAQPNTSANSQGPETPLSPDAVKSLVQGPQTPGAKPVPAKIIPIPGMTLTPQMMELVKLETDFEQSVVKGGGPAFASWFADDAVTLNNGQPAVLGHAAIAAQAVWDPKDYQLTWFIEGAQMGPSGDTAFTWGHYDASGNDRLGKPYTFSGRYTTFWKKVGGKWKVALDASSNEPPDPNSPNAPPTCETGHPR